jgi:hypothetical protein
MSFTITKKLLAPNTRATNLRISPWATKIIAYDNSENPEDGSFNMKHPKRCS